MAKKKTKKLDSVVIRFAGDSGDGMQLMGDRFTNTAALVGNDLGTFPDFPAEIRAPAGSLAGVSAFQLQFSSKDIFTPGDKLDVLVAMNPAALKMHIEDLKSNGILIANKSNFNPRNLKMAGWENNPLEDDSLKNYVVYDLEISRLVANATEDMGLSSKVIERTKNFFGLGLLYWMYGRPMDPTKSWLEKKFKNKPELVEANLRALNAGYNFGDITESMATKYEVGAAPLKKGTYRNIVGNYATGLGLLAASQLSKLPLFFGGYPITPASDILHQLSHYKNYGVKTFQAEDEISGIGSVIGAAFTGSLGVTATSGPGIALKTEAIGLGVISELPMVIINVQRGGPSTGLPTKTEQADLLMAMHGRNGESPIPVIAASTPGDCFYVAYEACRIAIKYMTPVFILSDGFIANGSEPWMLPDLDKLKEIKINEPQSRDGQFLAYERDEKTLARSWAIPGLKGFEHRVGGIEKEHITGNVNYDPDNHDLMVKLRAQKVSSIVNEIPKTEIYGNKTGEILILGWGSTFGAIRSGVESLIEEGKSVSQVHLKWINPLPSDLGEILLKFQKILIPEINSGQLIKIIRSEFLIDAEGFNLVRGKPYTKSQIIDKVKEMI